MEELVDQLEAELAAKIEENELLEQMVNAGGDGAAVEALQAENQQLREQVAKAKDLPKLEAELRRAKNEARVLKAGNEQLNKNLKAVSAQLETAKASSASTANSNAKVLKQAKELAKTGKEAKAQLVKIYEENEELRSELTLASKDLATMAEALQLKDSVIAVRDRELTEARDKVQEKELRLAEMSNEYAAQQKDMETLLEGISAAEDAERLAKEETLAAAKRYEAQLEASDARFKELEDAKAEVDAECARLKNDTAAGRTERELDELKAKLADSAREKEELAAEVASVQESFLKLGQEMVQMQMDQAKQLDAAREDERAAAKGVYDTLEACQFDLETERSRASELEQRNLQLETDLREADEWRVKYEQRWGLSEAVAYQNQLKNQLQIRDDQIAKLNFDISAAQSNIQKMDVALRILRRECGKPDDWMPAGIMLEEDGLRSSREKWKHKTYELEAQNEELEEQRLRLLQKLRQQAEMSAGPGTKFFGLSPDQCDIVFQYIEELREGGTEMPLNDKSRELQKRVNELEAEIGKLRKHGIKTATELAAGATVHYHEASPTQQAAPASGPVQQIIAGDGSAAFPKELQDALMRLFDENSKLRRDLARITQDLPHLVSELHQRQEGSGDGETKQEATVPNAQFQELVEERDALRADLDDALQQVDDNSREAVIRRWVQAKIEEFETQRVAEEMGKIAQLDVSPPLSSKSTSGQSETKSVPASDGDDESIGDGTANDAILDDGGSRRKLSATEREAVRRGLSVAQRLLANPGIPEDYTALGRKIDDELQQWDSKAQQGLVPQVHLTVAECNLLQEVLRVRMQKEALAAKFERYHDDQEERIIATIFQSATPDERGARALSAAESGKVLDEGAIRAERKELRDRGMAESYDEFMADRNVEKCRQALESAMNAHASATAGLDNVQVTEADTERADRARLNLEVAEKRLAKAVDQRKANEAFQAAELQKLQDVLDQLALRLDEARHSREAEVAAYRRALEDGADAARFGMGRRAISDEGGANVRSTRISDGSTEQPFAAEPQTAAGRVLLSQISGVAAPPGSNSDLTKYVGRYRDMLAKLSNQELAVPSVASTVHQLLAHLVLCFEELTALNGSLSKVHKVLQYVEPKIGNAAALQALLYHDHARVVSDAEQTARTMRQRCERLEVERDDLQSRASVLDEFCSAAISGQADSQEAGPVTLARFEDMDEEKRVVTLKQCVHKIAELQLVKSKLTRRCRILRAAEEIAKNSANQVQEELREAQVVYKSRILFLELWRHGAMARIASLQKTVSVSVPQSTVDAFMAELTGLRSKYHGLLTEHAQVVLEVGVLRQAKLERAGAAMDKVPIDEVRQSTTPTKAATSQAVAPQPDTAIVDENMQAVTSKDEVGDSVAAVEAAEGFTQAGANAEPSIKSVALKADVVMQKQASQSHAQADDIETTAKDYTTAYGGQGAAAVGADAVAMAEAMVSKDGQIAKLRAELHGTRKNMRALKKHCHILLEEARQAVDLQKKQADDIASLRKARDAAEAKMHELSASASSSTVHEELATARKVAEEASAAAEAAKRDSLKHRGLLEIATAQADALELKQAVSAKEVESLREHVRELAAASNDALIIGKLQQETMAKTLTYMQFARKFKAAMVQLRSKELQNRELMKRLDNVTEMLHSASQQAHIRVAASNKLLADLTGRMTGGLTMEQSEMLSRHLKDLLTECTRQEQEMERLRRRIEDCETGQAIAVADAELARRETNTLRERILVMAKGDPPGTQPDVNAARWATTLVELSDELRSFKLANLRHQRRIASLQEDKEHLRRRFKQNASSAKVLEEELVDKDDALRKQLLGLAGRHPASTNAGNYVVGSVGSSESARAVQDALNSLLPNLAPDKGRVAADGTILAERDELDEQNRKLAAMQDKNRSTRVAAHEETAALLKQISDMRAELQRNAKQVVSMTEQLTQARLRVKLLEGQISAEGLVPIDDRYNENGASRREAEADAARKDSVSSGRGRGQHGNSQLAVLPEDKHLQEAAKHTVKVLKKLLAQKNATLERYDKRLRAARAEREAERARLEAEVARLQGLLEDTGIAGATEDIRDAAEQVRRARGLDRRAQETAQKLERALRARVEEVEDLLDVNQKELYAAQDALAETRRRLKAAEIKNGERLAENEILRGRAVETQHMAAQYPKMQARLRKLDKKLQRSRQKEKKLRGMLRGAEMAELEGSDYLGTSKRTRKKKKQNESDAEEKKDENAKTSGSDKEDDAQDSSSDSNSVSSDEGDDQLLNDPVDGDSALAVMVRKIRRRFNKKQAELGDIKKQFEDLREELIQVTGDLEEARVVARSARERALDEAKADFDAKTRALADRHEASISQLQGQLDNARKQSQNDRTALESLGAGRVTAAEARTVGQLQQRNAVLKHQLDRTQKKVLQQQGQLQKLQEEVYVAHERLKNATRNVGNSAPKPAEGAPGRQVEVLEAQNKVLRKALEDINREHEKKMRAVKQKVAVARAASQHAAASEANQAARSALLDAQKRITTLSKRVQDKDEVLARSRAALNAAEQRAATLRHELELLKEHQRDRENDPVTAATLENSDLKEELAVLRRKNDRLQQAASAEAENADQLQRRLAKFREDLMKKDEEVFQLEKELATLRRQSPSRHQPPQPPQQHHGSIEDKKDVQDARRDLAAVSRRLDEREQELHSLRRRHKAEMRELQEQLRAADGRLQRQASSENNRAPRAQDENFDAETYRRMTHAERKLERVLAEREQLLVGVKKMKALVVAQTEEIHALKVKVNGTSGGEGSEVPAWVESLGMGQVASPAAAKGTAGGDLRANYAVLKDQYRDAREQASQASTRIQALEYELSSMTQRLAHQQQQLRDSSDRVVSVPHGAGTAVDELLQDKARLQGQLRALEDEAQRLKSDNRRLKQELSAFDPAFFKDLEQLRERYVVAMRRNKELERKLRTVVMSGNASRSGRGRRRENNEYSDARMR